nr:DUF6542 domain-containing protein [Streptomyces sp. NRRL S-340]
MEQHWTRPQQHGPRRGRPPLPSQAAKRRTQSPRRRDGGQAHGQGGAADRRPAQRPGPARRLPVAARDHAPPPVIQRLRQVPNPRLTGLGGGLFCGAVMFVLGCLDALLLDASPAVYGVLFLPVCVLTAVWIRRGDLLSAPVVVPIGFAVGLLPVADGGEGLLGTLMGLVSALATQAVWLYAGTLIAGVTALVRRAASAPARAAERAGARASERAGAGPGAAARRRG